MENVKKYKYWTWSTNELSSELPTKSMRKPIICDENDEDNTSDNNDNKNNEANNNEYDIGKKNTLNNFVPFETIIVEPNNKRSENSERISAREMIIQTNINPFLNNNYLDDIKIQDTILRPKDSNYKDEAVNYNQ